MDAKMKRFKCAVACLKDERVWVFPLVDWARGRYSIDVTGTCMATHSTPVDHAELGASLLAAIQVYQRPMTEEERTKGYDPQRAMGYRSNRTWRRGLGSVKVSWKVDDDGTATFSIIPDRAQGLSLFAVPEARVLLENNVTPVELGEKVMKVLTVSQNMNGGPQAPKKAPSGKKRARAQAS
jgi:hypothetical protein